MPPKKVAAVVTEYRRWSHADVILRNLLGGYPDGTRPDLQLVSLVTDQVPKTDMSRELAKTHGFRICNTVAEALTLGGDSLAVDAVLSIGEHGQYPDNEKGQKLYPRRRFFADIAAVFERTRKSVPVFNDKHLAATWEDAKWMYDTARRLMIPFLAGSSVPVTWRKPDLTLPRGGELTGAVQIGYGPFEGYGFHALEGLQCMVERRAGGETGVAAVTCHTGPAMWATLDRQPWAGPLLEAGLKLVPAHAAGNMREITARTADAGTFEVEYRDGFRAFVVIPNGWIHEGDGGGFVFAGQVRGRAELAACQFYLQQPDPFAHFAELTKAIDALARTGHAPYPVERTLLTTGVLDAAMTSKFRRGARVETPHLDVRYRPTDWGGARGEVPRAVKP
ncbi:MAG TPA: hypothetical protein VH092_22050 [Urbifossiella sp.]|jgi:hypothetical protein|nr:hypothetical protein [Urbifossiella sp.]